MTDDSQQPFVTAERTGAVLVLRLNRPEKSNSLHPRLVAELADALCSAATDGVTNAVVITGSGRTFCAGLDLDLLVSWTDDEKLAYLTTVTALFRAVWEAPQPVIAAVNGPAIA